MNSLSLPIEQLSLICRQKIRNRIKNDPFFIRFLLYPEYGFKDFHEKWFYMALSGKDNLCLGPRKSAKTTVRGVMASIYMMTQNPNIRIGIVSDTREQAVHFSTEIKQQCENNQNLLAVYPELMASGKWNEKNFTIQGAKAIQKGATITAFGYGSSVTGYEFDYIIIDDIVDLENSRTVYQREKLEKWIKFTLMPMLVKGGYVSWNGTRYHYDDIYGKLIKEGIFWNEGTHKAIKDDGSSYWEEVWSIKELRERKEKLGSMIFNAQYQNDVTLMEEGSIFKREWFKYFQISGEDIITTDGKRVDINSLEIYQTCDLAISQKETSDYFVILTFGVDKEGNIYILDVLRGRYTWNEQKQLTAENYARYRPIKLGVEDVQYQRALIDELNNTGNMSIVGLDARGDKVSRAMSISAKYEMGKVYHNRNIKGLEEFEDELTSFPDGDHDDQVDTVSYITQVIRRDAPNIWLI